MVGEACFPSNAYYPRMPDYTLCSGVHVCWSEHSDSSFVYGFIILDYGFGTMTATTLFLYFSVLLALRLPRLGKRELILVLFCSICAFLSVFSSSWCLGRAAVCDCGTPLTFLLPFFSFWYVFSTLIVLAFTVGLQCFPPGRNPLNASLTYFARATSHCQIHFVVSDRHTLCLL